MAPQTNKRLYQLVFWILVGSVFFTIGVVASWILYFEQSYENRVYPNVFVEGISFNHKTKDEVIVYWSEQSKPLSTLKLELKFENQLATVSGAEIGLSYDATLSATQALAAGRSEYILSNIRERYGKTPINLPVSFTWNDDAYNSFVTKLENIINIPVQNALFQFSNGKVIAFKPSHPGRAVNKEQLKGEFIYNLQTSAKNGAQRISFSIPVDTINPVVTTNQTNAFGIKELIGKGYSEFSGSIPGRIHNVALAASKINGILIPPGATFSFNQTVGDISAVTGYQSAYIIKDGRNVLGDGGGVCQVSTTLFRSALSAGLPIVERHPHSYRVHYYEEGGFKPGIDATVFNPTDDLKFINDTPAYILIQTRVDTENLTATFELYGATDGRKAEILNQTLGNITAPPAPLYQDDPTLPVGVIRQVDFEAWGATATFEYRVTKEKQVTIDQKFVSNYQPWQAIYLKGTK